LRPALAAALARGLVAAYPLTVRPPMHTTARPAPDAAPARTPAKSSPVACPAHQPSIRHRQQNTAVHARLLCHSQVGFALGTQPTPGVVAQRPGRRRQPIVDFPARTIRDSMPTRDSRGPDLRGIEPLTSSMPRKRTTVVPGGHNRTVWGERSWSAPLTPGCSLRETHDDPERHTASHRFITGRHASA
jgi:hypothetical protein